MNLLQACIDVLFFHHPAAWWISAQVRAEREHCADDLAVRALEAGRAGTRLSYARALLALEERRQTAALAVAANGGSLLDRIRRLAGADDEPAGPGRLLAAGLTAAAVVAIALSIAAPRQATAAELPEDTNKIESLTPEQARNLAEEFPGVAMEFEVKGVGKNKVSGCLPLNSLKSLDAETARALARYAKGPLVLNGLTALDTDTAKALAEFKGHLMLFGLTTLDADTAKALADFKGDLGLLGLNTLETDSARALAECNAKSLGFSLPTLDAATAKALAGFKGPTLRLFGLTMLDAATAKGLAEFKGQELHLLGLTTLSDEAAKALAQYKGRLDIENLTTLTNSELAEKWAKDGIGCKALTTLSADAASMFAQHSRNVLILTLDSLTGLDAATAKALAEFKGKQLALGGLTTLDADAAKALAQFEGRDLILGHLTTLDADTAKALGEFKGAVHLPLFPDVKEAFFSKNPLTPETALAWAVVSNGDFSHVTTLDSPDAVAIAQALAKRKGPLNLPNLKKISPKTLTALLEKEDVEIPLIETLELIQEPDGSTTEDFVIPERFQQQRRTR
jgi:hypothetical protein